MSKDTSAPIPYEATQALVSIGEALRSSRLARKEKIATAAERIGVATSTWQRIEAGDPGTSCGILFSALATYGYSEAMFALGNTDNDAEGKNLQRQSMPMRGSA